MTSSGRRWAAVIGVVLALALPKHVECGYPAAAGACARADARGALCSSYEVEPWGFYLLELVARRDVGFAYSSGDDCR